MIGYSYDEAMDIDDFTRAEVTSELHKHGLTLDGYADFFSEIGSKEEYTGEEVLNWLGH